MPFEDATQLATQMAAKGRSPVEIVQHTLTRSKPSTHRSRHAFQQASILIEAFPCIIRLLSNCSRHRYFDRGRIEMARPSLQAILEVIAIVAASTITNYTGMIAAHAKGPPAQ